MNSLKYSPCFGEKYKSAQEFFEHKEALTELKELLLANNIPKTHLKIVVEEITLNPILAQSIFSPIELSFIEENFAELKTALIPCYKEVPIPEGLSIQL
jgi:hypothetical protein